MKNRFVAILALVALAGCDRLGFGPKTEVTSNQTAQGETEAAAGNDAASARAPIADAGVTSSRSLSGLIGGGEAAVGDKVPGAIPAGADAGGAISRQALFGDWADDRSCKQVTRLRPDGTFLADNGGEGEWTLAGNELVLAVPAGNVVFRIQSLDGDTVTLVGADGNVGRSYRC